MGSSARRPILYVEGGDDEHSIIHLLQRHGVDMSEGRRPFEIYRSGGVESLLAVMTDAVRAAANLTIGFVLDIDVQLTDRWSAVRSRLVDAGLSPPEQCPGGGYIGRVPEYRQGVGVGVWMMPDCGRDRGRLEHLLHTLVPAGDRLWPHALQATGEARGLGAAFAEVDREKAVLHCWLAWQEDPGLPFGTAIKAKYLGHDSPEARAFLGWIRQLFAVSPAR